MRRSARLAGLVLFCGCVPYTGNVAGVGFGLSLPNKEDYWNRSGVQIGVGGGGYVDGYGGSGSLHFYEYDADGTDGSKLKLFTIDLVVGGAGVAKPVSPGAVAKLVVRGGVGARIALPTYDMCSSEREALEFYFGLVNPEYEFDRAVLLLLFVEVSVDLGKAFVGAYVRYCDGDSKFTLSDDTLGKIFSDDWDIGGLDIGLHGRLVF